MRQAMAASTGEKLRSMRIGVQGSFYPVPEDIPRRERSAWQIRRLAALGCTAHQIGYGHLPGDDPGELSELKALAASLGVALELTAPGAFGLTGPYADGDAKTRFSLAVKQAETLGVPVIRTGYGRLNVQTSRFRSGMSVREHVASLVPSLREAGRIAADAGLDLAVENHCDFTGRELAELLERTDLPNVGAALDTANGFTVFSDPRDDIEALAPYAFTTHLKDMVVVDMPLRGYIPMTAQGCGLGEGHVDLSYAIEQLALRSPRAQGLYLLIEPGWMAWRAGEDELTQQYRYFEQGIRYIQGLVEALIGREEGSA